MMRILICLALITIPSLALADEMGDFIVPNQIEVSLVHHEYMEPDQFGLMMKTPNAMTGCYDVSGLEYQTKFIENNYMEIVIDGYRRMPIKNKDMKFDCNVGTKVISAMIPLNAQDLFDRHIREIHFRIANIEDNYKIELGDNNITLIPQTSAAFLPKGDNPASLTYSYSGSGLVALQVPMAGKNEDISQELNDFATKFSLVPVTNPSTQKNIFLFTDPSGLIVRQIGTQNYVELGNIAAYRSYNEGQGTQQLPVSLKVFATRPDTTL